MPLAVNDIVLVVHNGLYENQRYMFTQTWRVGLTTSTQSVPKDESDIALQFTDTSLLSFLSLYRACLATNYTITSVSAQRVAPLRAVREVISTAFPGTGPTTATTGNIAAVLTVRTQAAGRSEVANKHIGPLATSTYVSGAPTGGLSTTIALFGAKLITPQAVVLTDGNSLTLVPVIFHRSTGQSSLTDSISVSDRIGTMRRRTLRVGE